MALPTIGGGAQIGDGTSEPVLFVQTAPAAVPAGNATLTAAQLLGGMIAGSPGASAAAYTLPTVTLLEASLTNAVRTNQAFDFSISNIDGNTSGVITLTAGTGWTLVGLATLAAVAGTSGQWRARKTGVGTWTAYRLS